MNNEDYKLNCTAVQNEWKERHQNKGLNKFIYDGIVNENLWEKAEKRITLFLKEAYLKEDVSEGNLCRSLKMDCMENVENSIRLDICTAKCYCKINTCISFV